MPEPQTAFGKYRILERVAVGGTAEIYKARLDGIGGFHRTFAIKRILPHLSARPEFVEMLVEEAKIAGLLSHANIVQIMDLGQVNGAYYIAMEYVDGPDLGRVMVRCREKGINLPVPHAVFIGIEMLKGLEYAHQRQVMRGGKLEPLQVVHRDVSPANVLVSLQGEVKLTDFGIAKASVKALQTVSGVIKGRFNYMSPEQAAGANVDLRTDLFATGVVLYEMLTGRHPFTQPNEAATLDAIRDGVYAPISAVNTDVPYALEQIIDRALSPNRDRRWASATEMKDALDRFWHDAGFIFSHSTLAAFLKGLFPEAARSADRGRGLSQGGDTRPLIRGQAEDEHRPTMVSDGPPPNLGQAETSIRPIPRPSLLDNLQDMSRSVALGPVAGLGEESTLIRSSPLPDEDDWRDANTRIRPSPLKVGEPEVDGIDLPEPDPEDWGGDAQTRIRPPPREEPAAAPAAPRPAAPPPRAAAPVASPAPAPARAAPARPVAEGPTSAVQQLTYLAAGIVLTMLVLLVGVLIGVRVGPMIAPGDGPGVTVSFPFERDQALSVNGEPMDTPTFSLRPGAYTVRVSGASAGRCAEARVTVHAEGIHEIALQPQADCADAGR